MEAMRKHNEWVMGENRRVQAERERAQEENHKREMQRAEEERKRVLEAQRVQAEKDRIQAEKHAKELREMQAEKERVQKEKERIQKENHEKELQRLEEERIRLLEEARKAQEEKERVQAEIHAQELQRAREEKERLEEAHRLQEEARILEEKIRREEEKRKMEALAKKIEEDARQRVEKEIWLREEAERNLERGIPAVKYPTGEEFEATRKRLQYREGDLHFAITGVSGVGKSSLINAFRGCSNSGSDKDPNIAKTGTSETTETIGRYCDAVRPWLIWYDVPGAGTLKVPSWQYFNDQGLYIFDIIIIVIGDRFTKIDMDLLFNCKRFGIPAFVVRSKANAHISNIMSDDSDDSADEDDEETREKRFTKARDRFVTDTRRSFESVLKDAGLPPQHVYIVAKDILRALVKGSKTPSYKIIDEVELMTDVIDVANARHNQDPPQYS